MSKIKYKYGNIFIPVGIVILIIIVVTVFLVYYQLNVIIENVRRDLFYASNNAILSFDTNELAYKKYVINEEKAKQIIEYILNKNYTEKLSSITKIEITDLKIMNLQDNVNLKIQVKVTFNSVISIAGYKEHSFKMNESINISLLKYIQGDQL